MFFPSAQLAAAGPALASVPVVPAAVPGAPAAPSINAPAPDALDRWRAILDTFTAIRPVLATEDGQIVPATSIGDVQRAALRFSRMLSAPCYDGAQLAATRAAWRDALARVQAHAQGGAPWSSLYPDNPGWWLSDTRALAQRLAEVDRRRNGIVQAGDGTLTITSGRHDPLVTYLDLRAYFLARRLSRTDGGHRYPETTVADVLEVIRVVDDDIAATVAATPPGETAEWLIGHHRLNGWRAVAQTAIRKARSLPRDATHPDNRAIWSEYRKLSIPLSVARSANARPHPWSGR